MMIDACANFAKTHDLVFNKMKTKCMTIKPKLYKNLYVPKFYLSGAEIGHVNSETYLGYVINDNLSDELSIKKETRNLYARGNVLIRNFKHCTDNVKVTLFRTFCSSVYCCPLWVKYRISHIKQIHVAFNKVLKCLMNVRRDFSASLLFVSNRLSNFKMLRRKYVFSLMTRVNNSHNTIVETIVHSNFFHKSSMYRLWKSLLF